MSPASFEIKYPIPLTSVLNGSITVTSTKIIKKQLKNSIWKSSTSLHIATTADPTISSQLKANPRICFFSKSCPLGKQIPNTILNTRVTGEQIKQLIIELTTIGSSLVIKEAIKVSKLNKVNQIVSLSILVNWLLGSLHRSNGKH